MIRTLKINLSFIMHLSYEEQLDFVKSCPLLEEHCFFFFCLTFDVIKNSKSSFDVINRLPVNIKPIKSK